jgi:ribosomal-protein-alanine N-acetyltransferase
LGNLILIHRSRLKEVFKMIQNQVINTTRLVLIPLSAAQLVLYLEQEKEFSRQVGPVSREILTETLRRAINMKLEKLTAASLQDLPWLTYWLIRVLPEGYGAGMIGFKGVPDDNGAVEVGYGIDSSFRNMGYMTEALEGMIRWAFKDPRCERILAPDTPRSNRGSNRVLEKVGMRVYQEKRDSLSWCLERDQGNLT